MLRGLAPAGFQGVDQREHLGVELDEARPGPPDTLVAADGRAQVAPAARREGLQAGTPGLAPAQHHGAVGRAPGAPAGRFPTLPAEFVDRPLHQGVTGEEHLEELAQFLAELYQGLPCPAEVGPSLGLHADINNHIQNRHPQGKKVGSGQNNRLGGR